QLGDNKLTDNPLWHGCMYLEFASRLKITDSFTLRASMVAENRSFSGGLYVPDNTLIYPKFLVDYSKAIGIFKQQFLLGVAAGYKDSFKVFEGLTMYNNDVDNFEAYAQWKKLRATWMHTGDMIYNGGLNVDEMYTFIVSLEKVKFL